LVPWAIDACDLLKHIDGSKWEPTKPTLKGKRAGDGLEEGEPSDEELMVEDKRRLKVWKGKLQVWKHREAVVKQQIVGTIPDSLFMQI